MAQESVQVTQHLFQKNDTGVAEVIIDPNGTIHSESVQVKSTQGVELSNDLGQDSNPNQ